MPKKQKQVKSDMPRPVFRFLRNSEMSADGAPPIAEVRRQFETAQLIQGACLAIAGVPAERYDVVLEEKLGIDLPSLRKLARGMGVVISRPDWFVAAILRG